MKTLLSLELDSGYKLVVVLIDESGPLGVRLDNSKDEFVGQIFVSLDSLQDGVKRLSNNTRELTDAELKEVEQAVIKESNISTPKNESTSIGKMMNRRDLVNAKLSKFTYS